MLLSVEGTTDKRGALGETRWQSSPCYSLTLLDRVRAEVIAVLLMVCWFACDWGDLGSWTRAFGSGAGELR
ncbi:hypothetical protein GCM10010353_08260 [Streptomyces chryseus]|nr:hypothetical protein GCM10010353_08260 [Streptomyces chryseus]